MNDGDNGTTVTRLGGGDGEEPRRSRGMIKRCLKSDRSIAYDRQNRKLTTRMSCRTAR